MKAANVAAALRVNGIPVLKSAEGTREVDGEVEVSGAVHVQVPTRGTGLSVVRRTASGTFVFSPVRHDFDKLLADVRAALEVA